MGARTRASHQTGHEHVHVTRAAPAGCASAQGTWQQFWLTVDEAAMWFAPPTPLLRAQLLVLAQRVRQEQDRVQQRRRELARGAADVRRLAELWSEVQEGDALIADAMVLLAGSVFVGMQAQHGAAAPTEQVVAGSRAPQALGTTPSASHDCARGFTGACRSAHGGAVRTLSLCCRKVGRGRGRTASAAAWAAVMAAVAATAAKAVPMAELLWDATEPEGVLVELEREGRGRVGPQAGSCFTPRLRCARAERRRRRRALRAYAGLRRQRVRGHREKRNPTFRPPHNPTTETAAQSDG